MKNPIRRIDINSEAYRDTLKNFSDFYTEFFILTDRDHLIDFCGVGFKTVSKSESKRIISYLQNTFLFQIIYYLINNTFWCLTNGVE